MAFYSDFPPAAIGVVRKWMVESFGATFEAQCYNGLILPLSGPHAPPISDVFDGKVITQTRILSILPLSAIK